MVPLARSNSTMPFLQRYGFTNVVNGINKDQVPRFLANQG
jgi:hypothetical protein